MSLRWLLVYGYVIVLFVVTPWLPDLIKWAGSIWSGEAVKRFVLISEMVLGALLLLLAGGLFFWDRRRAFRVILIVMGIIAVSCVFYCFVPNPYEFTHLVEYAILAVLLFTALRRNAGEKGEVRNRATSNRKLYWTTGLVTLGIGIADELFQGILPRRFLTFRDIWLNGLGGVLGLVVVWGTGNRQKTLNRRERRERSKSEDGER